MKGMRPDDHQSSAHRLGFSCSVLILLGISAWSLAISPNQAAADTAVGGLIATDTLWTAAESPYTVTSSIIVQGADGPDGITTLTIQPGAEVRFNRSTQLIVGGSAGDPGALIAPGTEAAPILFTADQPTPVPGDWIGIRFYNTSDDATCVLEHCTVEYAGYIQAAVCANSASPSLRNCTISNSKTYGLFLYFGAPEVTGNTFTGSGNYDLYFSTPGGGTINGNTFENGLFFTGPGVERFSENAFLDNPRYPLHLAANDVRWVRENTFHNVGADSFMEVIGGTISEDATWPAVMPYHILGSITIQGVDGPDGITTVTIEPGAEIRFNRSTQLIVGGSSGNPGALVAGGTAEAPILFTANQPVPVPGDWTGIRLYDTSDDATCLLEHCTVEYAGYSNGAVYANSASPRILNSAVLKSKTYGISVYGTGSDAITISCNDIGNNQQGVFINSSLPVLHFNNFVNNAQYGIYNASGGQVNAEDNWWGDPLGPGEGGDSVYGNVDVEPWSAEENSCSAGGENQPPLQPTSPLPQEGAVRVPVSSGVNLSWTGGDPDPADTVTYDLHWGTGPDSLEAEIAGLTSPSYTRTSADRGVTYYWQVVAKDDQGGETPGPVWRFTTTGDPPDLTVTGLVIDPPGNISSGQNVTLVATIENISTGPVVDPFLVDFLVNGISIGTVSVEQVLLAATDIELTLAWNYSGGDPSLNVIVDRTFAVSEPDETNNSYTAWFSSVADNDAPLLVWHTPSDGAFVQAIQEILVTLADTQSPINDTVVTTSFTVRDPTQQQVPGTITEAADTFTFIPSGIPLVDGPYQVTFSTADSHGNTESYGFSFTIDTEPPGGPVITGGMVASGLLQPRPTLNSADQFLVTLEGIREPSTSVWINGIQRVEVGDNAWSVQLALDPGVNTFQVQLMDRAENWGTAEWVDIDVLTGNTVHYEYDAAGRLKSVTGSE